MRGVDRYLSAIAAERSVRTASSEQVRQPINKEGTEKWRQFEPWLGPLKRALGDVLPANIAASARL